MTPTVLIQTSPEKGGPGVVELLIAVLSFLGAAVWPIAFLVALWWFRDPIKAKINEATTLEGFGVKLLLADALGRAKEIEGNAAVEEESGAAEAGGTVGLEADDLTTPPPTVGAPINAEPPSYERIVAVSPETAILYQWGQIEERMVELAHVHRLSLNRRGGGHLIEMLDAADFIPSRLTSVIRDLYRVRNSAAHPNGLTSFSRHEVLNYRDAAEIVVKELDQLVTKAMSEAPKP